MPELPAPGRSVTKSVTIDRPVAEVYAFLANGVNWPRWAIINVLTAAASDEPGWWKITTAQGPGEIRIHADEITGVVDHDFRDDTGSVWTVPARVIPNGRGADFLMTFIQPAELDDDEFNQQLAPIDTEFATLKKV